MNTFTATIKNKTSDTRNYIVFADDDFALSILPSFKKGMVEINYSVEPTDDLLSRIKKITFTPAYIRLALISKDENGQPQKDMLFIVWDAQSGDRWIDNVYHFKLNTCGILGTIPGDSEIEMTFYFD